MYATAAPSTEQVRACDACRLLDGDATPKPVTFCGLCAAWLCAACRGDGLRRIRAFFAARARP